MIEEEGVVVEAEGASAKVALLKKSACEQCAAAGVCHPTDADQSFMEASNPLGAKKGQRVKVVVAPQVYLKASLILYGLPMAVFVTAAIIAKKTALAWGSAANSDLWAFFAGMSGLLLSFFFIKRYNTKVEKTQEYKPVIVQIIE